MELPDVVVSARGIRTLSRDERTDYAFLESYYLAPQVRTGAGAELPGDMRLRRITRPPRIESRSTGLKQQLAFLKRRTLHGERYRLLQLLREFETHPARFGGHTPLALTPDLMGNNNEVMDVIHIDSGSNNSNGSINNNKVIVILNEKEDDDVKIFTPAPVNTKKGLAIKSDDEDNSTKLLIDNTESVVIKSEDEDGRTRLRNTNELTASTKAGDGKEKSSTDSYNTKIITTRIKNKDDNDRNGRGSIAIKNHDVAAISKRNVTAIKTENEDDCTTNKRYKTSTDNTKEATAVKNENEDNSNEEGGSNKATNNYTMVAIKKEDEDEDENGHNIFINNNEDENVVIKMENEDDNNTEGSSNESINNYKNITAVKIENSYSIQNGGIRHTISSISPSSSVTSRNSSLNNQVMCDDDDVDNTSKGKSNNNKRNNNSNNRDVKINNNDNAYHRKERISNPIIETVTELQKVVSVTATKTSIEEVKMCFKCGTKKKACYYYNNAQWKEATGSGLCKDCRDNLTMEQMPQIAIEQTSFGKVKICFRCGTEKERRYFSKIQWKKAAIGCGSCIDCHIAFLNSKIDVWLQ